MSTRIRLREPTADDIELLDAWDASPEFRGEFNDFGPQPHRSAAERLESGFITEMAGTLLVVQLSDNAPVGTVDWRPAMYGPPPESRAFQLGISLAPEARGKGCGSEALRLCAKYLFENTPANRVEGSTDVENTAAQRALERAGFSFEGTNRGAQWRRGAYHDLRLYAVLRGELGD
jgi:RimJ/RimL family protein N-acetyltransferase